MAEKFVTHSVYLQSADVNVLIIQFPDTAISDKLAPLAAERGLVYKSFYEDFVVGTCLADSSPFFYHVKRRPELMTKFAEIWQEVMGRIYHYSPGFKPGNIVINENNVLKTRKDLVEGELFRSLEDNDFWNRPAPSTWVNKGLAAGVPKEKNPFRDDSPIEVDDANLAAGQGGNEDSDHLPYELMGHVWDTVGLCINVRQYENSPEALVHLVGSSSFQSKDSYYLLVVQRCIEDWSGIIDVLDQMGPTISLNNPQLLRELYEIALEYNPFLKLEDLDVPTLRRSSGVQGKNKANGARQGGRQKNVRQVGGRTAKKEPLTVEQEHRFSDVSRNTVLRLADSMRKHVVGQDQALNSIADAVQRASVGLKRDHEPLGVFLFTGNTGVGKTETAKALATCLTANLVRIDCQDYQHSHEVSKLAGSPPGYAGHEEGGQLTNAVTKYPFSVVLFDEVEKAHGAFQERLLQIIDDGVLTDNKGNVVSFKDTIIILTSNIGVDDVESIGKTVGFGSVSDKTEKKVTGARSEALKKKFKAEFLNRIDEIVHFRLLEKSDYLHILDIILSETEAQIKKSSNIALKLSPAAKSFLLEQGIDKKFGVRPLRRIVKRLLNTPLAKAVLAEDVSPNSKVIVGLKEGKLTFKTSPQRATKAVDREEAEVTEL